jgi:prevent-host-death family protein
MPLILPSSDLRNKYNEISETCHKTGKPIYITKNGKGDLAVMDINVFEYMIEKYDLYSELEKGIKDIENGDYLDVDEAFAKIEKEFGDTDDL